MYEVGLGDSPVRISGYLSGNAQRYGELLVANPHKPIVYVGGMPTFSSLGVGEHLNVPSGFVGDALAEAFAVGTHEEAFERLEQTFGIGATPESAFDALEQTFGTSGDFDDLAPVKRTEVVFTDPQIVQQRKEREEARAKDPWVRAKGARERAAARDKKLRESGNLFGDIIDTVTAPVKAIGRAAGKSAEAVGKVTANVAKATGEGLVTAAKFVEQTGGDAVEFMAEQAKAAVKDPLGYAAKVASTGGLSLVGIDPQKALAEVGVPTPDTMLKKLGLPTTEQITHVAFESVTNPKALLDKIPGVNELTKYIPGMPDPTKMAARLVDAAMRGDLKALKTEAFSIGHLVSDVASMVPGVGNVVGGPLASAITLLETGSALKAALSLLLGQIPGIPPPVRDILRVAFNAIADIVEKSKSVTDVLLAEFKRGVQEQARKRGITGPIADIIESALDGAIQLIFKHKPLDKAALDLAERGLDVARKNVAKGVAPPKELLDAEKTLSDLQQVYTRINSEHALTQGIVKLAKQDLAKKNPVVQKKIKDLRAAIEGEKLIAQAHGKKVSKALKRRPPTLRKKPSPKRREELRQLAALKQLSPEEQKALAALSPEEREELRELAKLSPQEQEELRKIAEAKAAAPPAPAPPAPTPAAPTPAALTPPPVPTAAAPLVPAPAAPRAFQYGPYPQATT